MKKLYLSDKDRKIAGVCGGLGEYYQVDPTVIRIIWIVLTILSLGVGGIVIYLLMWLVIPRRPKEEK
jgi:phage shock protein C